MVEQKQAAQLRRMLAGLGEGKVMVLATADRYRVSARSMSVVVLEDALWFQTDAAFEKSRQLAARPQAALCREELSVEGSCVSQGPPVSHPAFCAAFARLYPSSYQRYTRREGERLWRMEPLRLRRWIYREGKPFVETLDLEQNTYTLQPYADCQNP